MKKMKPVEIKNPEGTVGYDIDTSINHLIEIVEKLYAFDEEGAQEFIEGQLGLLMYKLNSQVTYFKQYFPELELPNSYRP